MIFTKAPSTVHDDFSCCLQSSEIKNQCKSPSKGEQKTKLYHTCTHTHAHRSMDIMVQINKSLYILTGRKLLRKILKCTKFFIHMREHFVKMLNSYFKWIDSLVTFYAHRRYIHIHILNLWIHWHLCEYEETKKNSRKINIY